MTSVPDISMRQYNMVESNFWDPETPEKPSVIRSADGPPQKVENEPIKPRDLRFVHSCMNAVYSVYEGACTLMNHRIIQSLFHNQILASFSQTASKVHGFTVGPLQYVKGFSASGVIIYVPRMIRHLQKSAKNRGWRRFHHFMKATQAVSIILDSTVKTAIGLEMFKFSAQLGAKGYPFAESLIKNVVRFSFPLGALSWSLSYATLAIDIVSLWKSKKAYHAHCKNTADYNVNEILQKTNTKKRKKRLQKIFAINNADALLAKLSSCKSLQEQKIINDKLKMQFEKIIFNKKSVAICDGFNFVATPLIFTSFLHPLGYGLVAAYVIGTTANFFHRQITTYQFENDLGLIERKPGSPFFDKDQKVRLYHRIADFSLWFFKFNSYITIQAA
jgi:hypothetical protein